MKRDERQQQPQRGNDKQHVQVIARAAAIMRALEHAPTGLSLGQLAAQTGLPRSTVQRIVAALAQERLLVAASPEGRVLLGPTLLRLAAAVESEFVSTIRPFLMSLSLTLKETVDLAIIRGDHLVFIDQVVGSQRLRTVSAVGDSFPLYCTANGKACLALMSDDEVTALLRSAMPARTDRTLTDLPKLLNELAEIRRTGIAFDREEHTEGIAAAGIALRAEMGSLVAISIPVPVSRFAANEKEIVTRLLNTRDELTSQLASLS